MLKRLERWWEAAFLEERPSVSLSLFRLAVAATVGLHVIPTLLQMKDNYLGTAFREYNPVFFPIPLLAWVDQRSDAFVWAAAAVFLAGWLGFLIGLATPLSGAVMTAACYFFYARNSLHIGTLSWDILLVTVFLMLVTPYPGDSFSVDSLLRGDPDPYLKRRPFFLQRLLQLQIASTYFYTGLNKIAAGGNWLTDNPYYYLMNDPPEGVIKDFIGRSLLAAHPTLCYGIGLGVVAIELTLWVWLFSRRTRPYAIAVAIGFHFLLLFTMHVPTIFFFLFPPQLLLFISPENLTDFLKRRRAAWKQDGRDKVIYDGGCGFCRASLARLSALDPTGRLEPVDSTDLDPASLDRRLTAEAARARLQLLERDGRLSGGFEALQRLSVRLPLLWPLAPLLNLPGADHIGGPAYDWVARNRYVLSGLHRTAACRGNACLGGSRKSKGPAGRGALQA